MPGRLPAPFSPAPGKRFALLLAGAWFLAVAAGFLALWTYKMRPGAGERTAPGSWPVQSRIHKPGGRAALLLFAHPRCACTRASIAELAWLMARFHDRLDGYLIVDVPQGAEPEFAQTDLWSSGERIPGVTVMRDDGGAQAQLFGVKTSGAAVLYDRAGRLSFQGGITPARGHEGDSFGRQRIVTLLEGGRADRADAPVFGCALESEEPVRVAHGEGQMTSRGSEQ
jgi:hypothetical protein